MPASSAADVEAVPPVSAGRPFHRQLSLALQVASVVNEVQSVGVPTQASVVDHAQLWLLAQVDEVLNEEQGVGVPVQLS